MARPPLSGSRLHAQDWGYNRKAVTRTYDLALAILHEEIEHEAWFLEFLGEGPSGHYRRSGVGSERNSPYLSKFLPH